MKKIFLFLVLIAGIDAIVFSLSETWESIGFEYGNFFERTSAGGNTVNSYMGSPGINLNVYQFWNSMNVGMFAHGIFTFPKTGVSEISGIRIEVDLSNYVFLIQDGIILGPGFRYSFNEKLKLQYGIGFSVMGIIGSYKEYVLSSYSVPSWEEVGITLFAVNLGIGGDIGIKYDLTDVFYINIGSILTFDFANYTIIKAYIVGRAIEVSDWSKNYSMFGVRPYICIGFNSYKENNNSGK